MQKNIFDGLQLPLIEVLCFCCRVLEMSPKGALNFGVFLLGKPSNSSRKSSRVVLEGSSKNEI